MKKGYLVINESNIVRLCQHYQEAVKVASELIGGKIMEISLREVGKSAVNNTKKANETSKRRTVGYFTYDFVSA